MSATLPAPARWPGRQAKRLIAAALRTHGHGSTHGQHPSRREHATVLVGVLCATNGTPHQQRHKHTTHSSEQPIFGSLMRVRTRNDAWDHASPIVHARLATNRPHLPSKAQHCTMSGNALVHTCMQCMCDELWRGTCLLPTVLARHVAWSRVLALHLSTFSAECGRFYRSCPRFRVWS